MLTVIFLWNFSGLVSFELVKSRKSLMSYIILQFLDAIESKGAIQNNGFLHIVSRNIP